ncbi:MAG TPA: sigma-70 family RNA polymerase sigma factor [Candidatus Binataceae bacterium]|nr:sigma-70 family RNA polymerase sigma factor [Candidatus Binataceae bacterium]
MGVKRVNPAAARQRFEATALPHLDAVYTAALRLARNSDDAKDLLQDTILRAYRFFHQFTPGTNCRAWLLTILYNNFRNNYRRSTREHTAALPDEFGETGDLMSSSDGRQYNPEEMASLRVMGRRLEAAINALPEEFREAVLLVDVQELNYREVAVVLGVPLGTVKSRVSRARSIMRENLRDFARLSGKTGT